MESDGTMLVTENAPAALERSGAGHQEWSLMPASEYDLAWAAGLFEGEGTTCATRHREVKYASVALCMNDEEPVRRFHEIVGVGNVNFNPVRGNPNPRWDWKAGAKKDVEYVVELLAPWLSDRRLVQAVNALAADFRSDEPATHCRKGHAFETSNTYTAPDGTRTCRTCQRNRLRRRYADDPEWRLKKLKKSAELRKRQRREGVQ